MDDPLIRELDRRLALLQHREHQGDGIGRTVLLQIAVFCWILPALLLIWGAF